MSKSLHRNEEFEQAKLIRWSHKSTVRQLIPALAYLHHSPNGGKRDAFTGAQMKALGVKPGFPDLILPFTNDAGQCGLAIEMKSEKGRVSDEQADWLAHLLLHGWECAVCRSAEEARRTICAYFGIGHDSVPALDA